MEVTANELRESLDNERYYNTFTRDIVTYNLVMLLQISALPNHIPSSTQLLRPCIQASRRLHFATLKPSHNDMVCNRQPFSSIDTLPAHNPIRPSGVVMFLVPFAGFSQPHFFNSSIFLRLRASCSHAQSAHATC